MICLGAGSPAPGESEISVKSTKILNMGKNRLLIVFTGVIIQLLLASCTYDYFKDETNYQVYVPEVVDNKVSVGMEGMGIVKIAFLWIFPILLLGIGILIWIRRKGR